MTSSTSRPPSHDLPVTGDLRLLFGLSLAVALILTVASVAGLVYPERLYPTDELLQSSMPNDVVNLVVGLPILLGSMELTRRGKLTGLLLWPGALFYVLYNTVAYVFSLPLSVGFLLALGLLPLSAYTTIGLMIRIDGREVKRRLQGAVPERMAGGILAALGGAFSIRAIVVVAQAIAGDTPLPTPDMAVNVADVVAAPAWVIGGVLLWRRRPLGYASGGALLFQTSTLFIAVIAVVLLQPVLTDAAFRPSDVVALSVMGLISFVPTGLFLRGLTSKA